MRLLERGDRLRRRAPSPPRARAFWPRVLESFFARRDEAIRDPEGFVEAAALDE